MVRFEVPEWWLDFTTAGGGRVKFAQRSGGGHSDIPTAGKARFQGGGIEWEFDWSDVQVDVPGNPPPSEHHSVALSAIRDEDGASMTSADHSGWGHGSVGSCYPAMDSSPTAPNYSRLRLYEYNGMPDGGSVMDNIDSMAGGFGEAVLYRKGDLLAISLPVVTTQAEQDIYCARVFDETEMLEPIGVSSGSGHDTRTTIVFDDAALNGEPNRVSYPEPGSAEEDALRASNGGKPHESTIHVAGCNNKTYATYLARTYNRQSRRSAGFTLTAPLSFRDVECGSGGTVLMRGLSTPVIVDDIEVDDEGTEVRIIVRHFSYLDTAWDVDAAVVESSHGGGLAVPPLPAPDSATATLNPSPSRLVDVAWTFPSAVAIKDGFIDIQIRKNSGTWEGLTTLAWGAFQHPDKLDDSAGVYEYRVRYRIDPWNAGAWVETNSVRVTEQRAVEQVSATATARRLLHTVFRQRKRQCSGRLEHAGPQRVRQPKRRRAAMAGQEIHRRGNSGGQSDAAAVRVDTGGLDFGSERRSRRRSGRTRNLVPRPRLVPAERQLHVFRPRRIGSRDRFPICLPEPFGFPASCSAIRTKSSPRP